MPKKKQHAGSVCAYGELMICVFMQLLGIALDQIDWMTGREDRWRLHIDSWWYGDAEADLRHSDWSARFVRASELSAAFRTKGLGLSRYEDHILTVGVTLSNPELCAEHARMLSIIR
jgi:hypothetical protein